MATTYTRRVALFDGSSGKSSTLTSDWHLLADYEYLSLSWHTDTTATSVLTLTASNDDGLRSAVVDTSFVTAITDAGIYAIDPGMRWLRAERASDESLAIVNMQLY
jgi:hypothetical protein